MYEKNRNRRKREFQDLDYICCFTFGRVRSKVVSKLMGHTKELITMEVYADNRGIIADGVPEMEGYMREVLPNLEETELFKKALLDIVLDATEFLPDTE